MRFTRLLATVSVVAVSSVFLIIPANAADRPELQSTLDAAVAAGIPGTAAEVIDESGRWRGAAGVAALDRPGKPDAHGRFRIGSVSKSFTAAVVLQLVAEGKLGLDDVVSRYLPGLLPYAEPITVRQLLQHTSGLPRDLPPGPGWDSNEDLVTERYSHFTPREMVRLSTSQPLRFAPGTAWAYSNTGFTVLSLLVEKLTGRPFEIEVYQRLVLRLGLRDTIVPRDFPLLPRAAARAYEELAPGEKTDFTEYNYSRYIGSGNILSTTADLNRFFSALLGGRLLPPAQLAEMKTTTPAVENGVSLGFDYGLGLLSLNLGPSCGNQLVWGHLGDLLGYSTSSLHSADGRRQVSSFINQNLSLPPEVKGAMYGVLFAEFCGTPVSAESKAATRMPVAPNAFGPVIHR